MKTLMVADYLRRNGIVAERARCEGRSLTNIERNIVAAGRLQAHSRGLGRTELNRLEMEGERDWNEVLRPLQAKIEFAYWDDPFEDLPAYPSFVVRKSNHPALAEGSNVALEQIRGAGFKTPKYPTYERWVAQGRKINR